MSIIKIFEWMGRNPFLVQVFGFLNELQAINQALSSESQSLLGSGLWFHTSRAKQKRR